MTDELVQRAQKGDTAAFEELMTAHEKQVYGVALRMTGQREDAADVTQEVFLAAWKNMCTFRGQGSFAGWLYRLTANACIDHLRREKRRRTVPLTRLDDEEQELELPDPSPGPEEQAERTERRAALRRAVAQLPEDQRTVLLLRETGGLSYQEIAGTLNIPAGTVKSRIARARLQLREQLARDGNFSEWSSSL